MTESSPDPDPEAEHDAEPRRGRTPIHRLVGKAVVKFVEDDAIHWGAALAYYTLISLAPLVILAAGVLGAVVGSSTAETQIIEQVSLLAGPRGAELASTVIEQASRPEIGSAGAVLITLVLFLSAATAVFANLQGALNKIWGVAPATGVLRNVLRTRLAAFGMVLALGAIMLVSLLLAAVLQAVAPVFAPLEAYLPLVHAADLLTSLLLLWLFVGAVYWVLPDARISWRDVWVGALATAVLLVLGRSVITAVLARNGFASMYGAAGSIFLLLIWVYFSAQVFFLGAEFTQVWARDRGRSIRPERYARATGGSTEEDCD